MPNRRRWRSKAAAALCDHFSAADPVEAVKQLVDSLLAAARATQPPADVELLASLRRVRRVQLVEMPEAGRLVPDGAGYEIHVNKHHPETKRRFTVAHELAHTFFDEAANAIRDLTDTATGQFDIRSEEEYLCDFGAARALLNPRWLEPLARGREPSLDALIRLAEACRASIEATAIQIAQLGLWDCTFAFWEPGLRKAERKSAGQTALAGLEAMARPAEKLRVRRVYGPPGAPFLPLNKSVDATSHIWRAYAEQARSEGEDRLDLGHVLVPAYTQSIYAPYFDDAGKLRPRVISCLVWRGQASGGSNRWSWLKPLAQRTSLGSLHLC